MINTLNYVNEYLYNCETNIDDCVAPIDNQMQDVWILDVIGIAKENGRIYVGLEVSTYNFPFGEIIHINFLDVWEYVYKDEMIEIIEIISNKIGEKLNGRNMFNS